MSDKTTHIHHTSPAPLSGLEQNSTHRTEVMAILPLECGCTYELKVTGDLPVHMHNGRIHVDPAILHDFLTGAAAGLTMAYGEMVLSKAACPPIEPTTVAPSTDTPQ